MSLTNAQLVRLEAGDAGTPVRDVASGDALGTVYYLSVAPLIADSQLVTLNGSAVTETTNYTLDDETGKLTFLIAPGAGTENIIVTYKGAAIPDGAIAEACRQFGLVASADAAIGAPTAILEAAAMVCDWRASETAQDFDFDTDGQSFKKGSVAAHWADRAAALRVRLNKSYGIVSVPLARVDGYNRRGEYTTRDIGGTAQNPRRYFYGEQDRMP